MGSGSPGRARVSSALNSCSAIIDFATQSVYVFRDSSWSLVCFHWIALKQNSITLPLKLIRSPISMVTIANNISTQANPWYSIQSKSGFLWWVTLWLTILWCLSSYRCRIRAYGLLRGMKSLPRVPTNSSGYFIMFLGKQYTPKLMAVKFLTTGLSVNTQM